MPTTIIKGIAADGSKHYTSISGWEADRRGDIVNRDTIEIAEVYGGGSVGNLTMGSGHWVTDATHYVHIRAAKENEHPGCFDSTKAYLAPATGSINDHLTILCQVGFTKIGPGLSIFSNVPSIIEPTHGIIVQYVPGNKPVIIDGVIIKMGTGGVGIRVEYGDQGAGTSGHYVKNSIVLGTNSEMICARATNDKMTIRNCTFVCGDGQTIVADNDGGGFGNPARPGFVDSDNNYLSAPSGYVVTGSGSSITKGAYDVTSNSEALSPSFRNVLYANAGFQNPYVPGGNTEYQDLHLKIDSFLRAKGRNLKNEIIEGKRVTVDIHGHDRPSTPDIGAIQFVSPRTIISKIKTSGGDYTTLNAWEAGRRGNLAKRNTIEVAEVYNGTTSTAVRMLAKNWGTSLQAYPIIRAAKNHGHSGVFDSAKTYIKNDATNKAALYCEVGNMHLGRGLCFENSFYTGGDDPRCIEFDSIIRGGPISIDGIIMKNAVIKDNNKMIYTTNCGYDQALPHVIKNSFCHTAGGSTACKAFFLHGNKWRVYNNIIWAFGAFASAIVSNGGQVTSDNNHLGGVNAYELAGGGSIVQGTHDATEDSSATTPGLRLILRNTTNFVNPQPVGYPDMAPDAHLPNSSPLIGAGANLSAITPSYLAVTKDIDGQLRSAPFDIGADEHSSPGTETVTIIASLFVLF